MSVQHNCTVGVDVSQNDVDFFFLNRKGQRHSGRRPRGVAALGELARELHAAGARRVIVEATGGLETPVREAFEEAGFEVCLVNPQRVREFARALGWLAKTDRLDAELLALYGERMQPAQTPLPAADWRARRELLRHRDRLVDARAAHKVQLRTAEAAMAAESLQRVIDALSVEIERLEQQLRGLAASSGEAEAGRCEQLCTAPGVGEKTAWTLLMELPELGRLSGREAAALAGLAPWAAESGAFRGRRRIRGGRWRVRRALYVAAWSAVRCDPGLAEFRQRLLNAGKAKKLATIAVARKLLVALNAMLRDGSCWNPRPLLT